LLAVLFIDLDNFKSVNDSLGHHVGDELLCRVAQRLTTNVRDSDLVSRLGGDEFVVVLSEVANSQDAAMVAQKLLEAVSAPIDIEGHRLTVSPSIGISLFPADGDSGDDLIRHADSAMYLAKESGRATYKFFVPELFRRASSALDLSRELAQAQHRREFVLHYQPQQRRLDGAIVGLEALVRWQHPVRGLVGPDEFIAFAETRGLVGGIDLWVLQAACRQMKAWHDMGCLKVPVAVNLSAINFRQGNLADEVAGILLETGLDATFLEIEITESVFLDRGGHAQKTMQRLRGMGVHLTLDDFGTGYSSLAYLKQYPIGKLKIDRSFVHELTTDSGNLALVTAIIQMAHGLRLKAVAEGVETLGQLNLLKHLGCDEFQGYLISRPIDATAARAFIGK
jgi:diguanylate cyclase (GGDEF)-like protein